MSTIHNNDHSTLATQRAMTTTTTMEILATILTNVEKVFIRKQYYASCLPATLIVWELARKYNIDVQPKCGTLSYDGMAGVLHFWNVFEGQVYDPTIKVMKSMLPTLNIENFKYNEDLHDLGLEEALMLDIFQHFQTTRTTNFYFSKAPNNLKVIRKIIYNIVSKCLE